MALFGFGNKYPYTDFHELNLDWILSVVRSLQDEMQTFVNVNTIKYADPILWDITSQYEQNTLVQDADGITYLSKQAVPSGVSINNTDYWLKVADFSQLADIIKRSICSQDDGASATSTENRSEGDLLWLNNYLYIVLRTINIGDAYVEGGVNPNIQKVTVEQLLGAGGVIKESIASADDGSSTTASANRNVGDLVWLNDYLYEVISPIGIGGTYVEGTNIQRITIEGLLTAINTNITDIRHDMTASDDGSSATSTANRSIGDLVWLNDDLYQVTAAINAGDTYVVGTNIQAITIENVLQALATSISNEATTRYNDDQSLQSQITALGSIKGFDPGTSPAVMGSVGSQDWVLDDSTNLSNLEGALWPTQIHHDFTAKGYTAPVNSDPSVEVASTDIILASQSNDSALDPHDNVAIQGIAISQNIEDASLFGANIIAGTDPTVNRAKLIGIEVDLQPGASTTVTEGAGIIVNGFNTSMPLSAMAIYGVYGGSFSNGLNIRGVRDYGVSFGSAPGTCKGGFNTQNATFTEAAFVAPQGQYLLATKDSSNITSCHVRDNSGMFEVHGRNGISLNTDNLTNAFYVYQGTIGTNVSAASTATAGAGTLPSNPVGFLPIEIGGTQYKIPFYNN